MVERYALGLFGQEYSKLKVPFIRQRPFQVAVVFQTNVYVVSDGSTRGVDGLVHRDNGSDKSGTAIIQHPLL